MRRVQRFICDECKREHPTWDMAERCEERDRKYKKETLERIAEEEKWQKEGHAVWRENGDVHHAPEVDKNIYGPHDYEKERGTSDCRYLCGCWMGEARSGGPVDPFGSCPKNRKCGE